LTKTAVGKFFNKILGKSCFILTSIGGGFPHDYMPRMDSDYSQGIQIDNDIFNLGLWDTAGQED
jgi:Ras-related C3 botulinum toxin substrate 1